jgi:AcrR family transcriptional regulator
MKKKTRNTRALIRKAAMKEFAAHGFAGARVSRISEAAGVNKQLIFYYFQSKAGLFEAIVKSAEDTLSATSGLQKEELDQFRSVFHELFNSLASSEEMTNILFVGKQQGNSFGNTGIKKMTEILSDCVSRGQGMGRYRDDLDPEMVARQAVVLLVGFFATENNSFTDVEKERKEWLKETSSMLNKWLSW